MPPHGWSTSSSTTFTYSFTSNYITQVDKLSTIYDGPGAKAKKKEPVEPSDDEFDAMLAEAGVVCLT